MDAVDSFWVGFHIVLFIVCNVVAQGIKHYLDNKPLGLKSLQDGVFKDTISVGQFCMLTFSMVSVTSRFEEVRSFAIKNPLFLTAFCAMYIFAYISLMINHGLQCITRILSIINLPFVEESLGENFTRNCVTATTIVVSGLGCIFFYEVNDLNTGTAASLFTNSSLPTGPYRDRVSLSLYIYVGIILVVLQALTEWHRFQMKKCDQLLEAHRFNNKVVKFTGITSALVIVTLSSLGLVSALYPLREKTQNYYLIKDLIISLLVFLLWPLGIVAKNENMKRYFYSLLKNSKIFRSAKDKMELIQIKNRARTNKVIAINIIEVSSLALKNDEPNLIFC